MGKTVKPVFINMSAALGDKFFEFMKENKSPNCNIEYPLIAKNSEKSKQPAEKSSAGQNAGKSAGE